MRHRRWAFAGPMILVLLLSLLAPFAANRPPAQARQADAPLVILLNGDLWQWTPGGELQQLTTWGYNQRPVLSPDGSRVAYTSWAEVAVEALASGQELPGTVPSNIWLLDVASGDGVRAAEQPGDVSYLVEGVPGRYAVRGTPSWSPDGMRLAWNELVEPNSQYQLVVYDVATGSSQVIVPALPFPFADAGHFPLYPVKWGSDGIAVMNGGFNAETGEFEETIAVYDPNGSLLSQTVVSSTATEQLFDFVWVEQDGRDMIGLLYPSGRRYVLNPLTGSLEETAATPELYSTSEPDASLTVTRTPEADESGNLRAIWTVNTSEGEPIMPLDVLGGPSSVAIAPDGQTLAYVNDAVYIWQNGQSTPVSGTEGIASPGDVALAWGGTAWRLRPAPETSAALAEATPQADAATGMGGGGFVVCAPMPRLVAGGQAQVIPGLPNVIRGLPGTGPSSPILGQIPGGGVFTVLTGPICAPEGRFWWQISYQGIVGWTPEGQGGIYWLQPYQPNLPPPACTLAPRLSAGTTGYVLPGLPNVLRTQPRRGQDSPIIGRIPGGGFFRVIEGPICGPEGHYWWRVDYQGLVGWTAEGLGTTYWVSPFGCANSPTPRLAPGMLANVTPGAPNTLRLAPNPAAGSVGQIPGGGVFSVLSGPQCGPDNRTWWRVNYQGIVGWTAEGDGGNYWLEPYRFTPPPPPTPVVECTLAPRLMIGGQGRVTPGEANVLRTAPARGSGSQIIGSIPPGGIFTVLSGPNCDNEGMFWWQVQYGGQVGWTPEGQFGVYWLEPVTAPPPPTQPRACALPPRLTIGAAGFVTPGTPNVIRSQPQTGSSSMILGEIPGGGFFRVLAGPQCGSDSRYWWQVNYQGLVGWTAEGEGSTYWVSPFVCSFSLPTRLVPGIQARVTPGTPNVLRDGPGTGAASRVIGEIPGGGVFTVLSGPQCGNDGRVWWRVNYGGVIGWTAEGEGGIYWLEPLG